MPSSTFSLKCISRSKSNWPRSEEFIGLLKETYAWPFSNDRVGVTNSSNRVPSVAATNSFTLCSFDLVIHDVETASVGVEANFVIFPHIGRETE